MIRVDWGRVGLEVGGWLVRGIGRDVGRGNRLWGWGGRRLGEG